MRFKYLLLILLLIPSIVSGAVCCSRTQIPGWWGSVDYLLAWRKRRPYPPLLTTSPIGTPIGDAGVLGLPTTSILFGGDDIWDSPRSGGYFDFGLWFNCCFGLGMDGFFPSDEKINFEESSDANGFPILARPFVSQVGNNESFPFSFPGDSLNGFIDFQIKNRVWGLNAYSRYKYYSNSQLRLDLLSGFMYTHIHDQLKVFNLAETVPGPDSVIALEYDELFEGKNNFYGALLGIDTELRWGWTGLQLIAKVGLGGMVNRATVRGSGFETIEDMMGNIFFQDFEGGLFALPSNIGSKSRVKFAAIPEIQAKINYHRYNNIGFSLGYLLVYWPNVTLANDVFDIVINPTQAFGETLVGEAVPQLKVRDSSFWLQALTAGIYFRF